MMERHAYIELLTVSSDLLRASSAIETLLMWVRTHRGSIEDRRSESSEFDAAADRFMAQIPSLVDAIEAPQSLNGRQWAIAMLRDLDEGKACFRQFNDPNMDAKWADTEVARLAGNGLDLERHYKWISNALEYESYAASNHPPRISDGPHPSSDVFFWGGQPYDLTSTSHKLLTCLWNQPNGVDFLEVSVAVWDREDTPYKTITGQLSRLNAEMLSHELPFAWESKAERIVLVGEMPSS